MNGMSIRFSGKKKPLGEFETENSVYEVIKDEVTASLAVPGRRGMRIEPFDELWMVTRKPSENCELDGAELNFDKDIGGRGRSRPQPDGLESRLRATDFDTVIVRDRLSKRQSSEREMKEEKGKEREIFNSSTKSPKKKRQNN